MTITKEQLGAIRQRLEAAKKCDDWGKDGIKLEATKEKVGSNAKIWYGDGDLCAEVHGNLGLGIDGDAITELFTNAIADMDALLAENDVMKEILFQAGSEIHLHWGHKALSLKECDSVVCKKIAPLTDH